MRASARLGFDESLHLALTGRGSRENRSMLGAHSSILPQTAAKEQPGPPHLPA
jgi:hypothetical protein